MYTELVALHIIISRPDNCRAGCKMQVAVVLHSNLGKSERMLAQPSPAQQSEDGVEAVLLLPRVLALLGAGRHFQPDRHHGLPLLLRWTNFLLGRLEN